MSRQVSVEDGGRHRGPGERQGSPEIAPVLSADRQGIRGGTTRSLDEGATVIELHKRQASELIESAIWQALKDRGEFHADDLLQVDVPADALNAIGARVNAFVRRGYMVEVGRRKSANPASNGRKSNVYRITEKGRGELERRAGVSAGPVESGQGESLSPSPGNREISADPGSREAEPEMAPLPRPGGDDLHNSQPGTVVAPEVLTLPLGDVPQAQTRRARYADDWDMEAA